MSEEEQQDPEASRERRARQARQTSQMDRDQLDALLAEKERAAEADAASPGGDDRGDGEG